MEYALCRTAKNQAKILAVMVVSTKKKAHVVGKGTISQLSLITLGFLQRLAQAPLGYLGTGRLIVNVNWQPKSYC